MKRVTIADLMDISFISEPALSPDGLYTAYVVSRQNYKSNDYESWLNILDNKTGIAKQLTFSGKEGSFIWDDNHTLLFMAARAEADKPEKFEAKTCFYRLDINGGEAHKAFEIEKNVVSIRTASKGRYVVNATVDLNAPAKAMDELLKEDEKDYHVIEEVPFWANGRDFVSRLRSTLFLFDEHTGGIKQITGDFFNVSDYDCDANRIAYAGCEYHSRISPYSDARIYDISSGSAADLISHEAYGVGNILLTDSGAVLTLSDFKKYGLEQLHDIYRFDMAAGKLRLACKLDMPIGSAVLSDCSYGGGNVIKAVGDDVYFIAQHEYKSEIYRLDSSDKLEKLVPFGGCMLSMDSNGAETVFAGCEPNRMNELYALSGAGVKRVTALNDAFMESHAVAPLHYMPFTNSEGVNIDGWIIEPYDYDPSQRYPAVLEIHGGPRCTYGEGFFHEMQALAGAGYFVFFCNIRGSEGYGEEFADLRGKYGAIDFNDLMEFTDYVLRAWPQIDPARLGAAGGSYGGFMCNWIEGHTDRFAAIASQRSISNWVADFGSSEIGLTFDSNEMCANPWNNMEKMWEHSPLKYACNARTPILFIHSLKDYNCTVDQSAEMFSAMKFFGVPARMCLFENENHSLSRSGKPRHRIRRLEEILGWFDKYLK